MDGSKLDSFESRFRDGDKRALARVISWIEDRDPRGDAMAHRLRDLEDDAWVIGITGPPGVGKSSLVEKLALHFLEAGKKIAVLAVDPTSPFSGGAVLGDRIRMGKTVVHPHAFVRSMGTRGALGGLARATPSVIRLLSLFGFDIVLVETVGVGQSEVEIVKSADTSVVVEAPGMGDSVQAIKAGVLEIGDLFVVNKADRPGANRAALEIETMLQLAPESSPWSPPVLMVSVVKKTGMEDWVEGLEKHRTYLEESGTLSERRTQRRESHLFSQVHDALQRRLQEFFQAGEGRALYEKVLASEEAPEEVAHLVQLDLSLNPSQGVEDA